jgi:protein SCO1/2
MLSKAKYLTNNYRFSFSREILRCAQDDRRVVLAAAFFLFLFAIPAEALSPNELSRIGFDQHIGQQLSRNVVFRNENGQVVSLGNCFGTKPTLLVLGYSRCPMLCTFINTGLIAALQELRLDVGKDFNVLDVSIDPKETVSAAAAKKNIYVRRYGRPGAASGWHSLIGDNGAIAQLTNEAGFRYAYDSKTNEFAHPSGFIILTPEGKISRYFFGVNFDPKELRAALLAASANEKGSLVRQLVLLCYHYNPITGKYGAAILNLVRACGIATVLGLVAFVVLAGRHGSSRRQISVRDDSIPRVKQAHVTAPSRTSDG